MRLRLAAMILFLWAAAACADVDDEKQAARDVQALLQSNKLAEAEQALDAELKQFPKSPYVHALRFNFAYAYRRAQKHADALRHMQKLVQYYVDATASDLEQYPKLANSLTAMGSYARVANETDSARKQFAEVIQVLNERRKSGGAEASKSASSAVHTVRLRLVEFLIDAEDYKSARAVLADELAHAKSEYESRSDSPEFILQLAAALQARVTLREKLGEGDLDDARIRQLAFLQTKAQANLENAEIIQAYVEAHIASAEALAGKDPLAAATILNGAKSLLRKLDRDDRELDQIVLLAQRSFPYLEQVIARGKAHLKLLDQPAFPLDVGAWISKQELSDADIKDHVVLLDFWAVWCGPCLEVFPHLNDWHKKYADRGLTVIGVTKYYNYEWDSRTSRPVKLDKPAVPQAHELAMLKKYAAAQELAYPLAVTAAASDFQSKYGVSIIPQTVLIDRQGKIRMIRVGAGRTLAKELEREIEKLLDEKPMDETE